MELKLIYFLKENYKTKSLTVQKIKETYKSIIEFKEDTFIHKENEYKYKIIKPIEGKNILFNIETLDKRKNIKNAKLLSEIKDALIKTKLKKEYEIIVSKSEDSQLYIKKLSDKVSKLETLLREFAYLILTNANGNDWEKIIFSKEVLEEIEKISNKNIKTKIKGRSKNNSNILDYFTFDEYFKVFFTEYNKNDTNKLIDQITLEIDNNNITMEEIKKKLLLIKEKTTFFKEHFSKYNLEFSAEEFEEIKELRNDVAHNRDLNHEKYIEYYEILNKKIKSLNNVLPEVYNDLEKGNISIYYTELKDILENISKIIKPEIILPDIYSYIKVLTNYQKEYKKLVKNIIGEENRISKLF